MTGNLFIFILQIYQGKYIPNYREKYIRSHRTAASEIYEEADIYPGVLVALDVESYRPEKPQIAEVISLSDDKKTIEILWYIGTWSGAWKIYKKRRGREMVESREIVPITTVKLSGFTFTKSGKLKQAVKSQLQNIYEESSGED